MHAVNFFVEYDTGDNLDLMFSTVNPTTVEYDATVFEQPANFYSADPELRNLLREAATTHEPFVYDNVQYTVGRCHEKSEACGV